MKNWMYISDLKIYHGIKLYRGTELPVEIGRVIRHGRSGAVTIEE